MAQSYNEQIVAEFRANEGKVGGHFANSLLLLLHHVGAKSGLERVNPVAFQAVGDSYAIFASNNGAERNPDWYYNLLANPEVTIEVGTSTIRVKAREASTSERQAIWNRQKQRWSAFADYESQTSRTIPVLLLEPLEA